MFEPNTVVLCSGGNRMMQIELLSGGAPECPLVRFFSPDAADFLRLRSAIGWIGAGQGRSWEVCADDGYALISIKRLSLDNAGVEGMTHDGTGCLIWSLSPYDWQAVSALLEPLCAASATRGFQWLDEAGRGFSNGLAVLASRSTDGSC